MVITLFDELSLTKQVVLMRGDIIGYQMNKAEAETVWKEVLRVYKTP